MILLESIHRDVEAALSALSSSSSSNSSSNSNSSTTTVEGKEGEEATSPRLGGMRGRGSLSPPAVGLLAGGGSATGSEVGGKRRGKGKGKGKKKEDGEGEDDDGEDDEERGTDEEEEEEKEGRELESVIESPLAILVESRLSLSPPLFFSTRKKTTALTLPLISRFFPTSLSLSTRHPSPSTLALTFPRLALDTHTHTQQTQNRRTSPP